MPNIRGKVIFLMNFVLSSPDKKWTLSAVKPGKRCNPSRILQVEKPDFILKTHTGILGVRGTSTYVSLAPFFTDIYNESGQIAARNILTEIIGKVILGPMEFSRIWLDLPPTLPIPLRKEDLMPLKNRMATSSSTSPTFASFNTGTINMASSRRVGGPWGGILTGNMTMTGSTSGGTSFNLTGPVTLPVSGNLTYFNFDYFIGRVTGSWTQPPR